MDEFLTSSAKHILPYYFLAFAAGELLLLLKEKRGLWAEIILALSFSGALAVFLQLVNSSSWAAEQRPIMLAVVNSLTALLPAVVLVGANQYIARIKQLAIKHSALFGVTIVTMFFWPLWALYVTCASGLDCL